MTKFLFVDFETFGLVNLKEVGLDNYSKHPATGVSMLGWSPDTDEVVEAWLPHLGLMPGRLVGLLNDPDVLIITWNAQFEHAIALLTGQAASSFSIPERQLTNNVPAIPIGVPSQILERRPDIAAAERTMSEANALIGIETAAYYPTFTIGGDLGLQSANIGSLFTWPSRFFSAGPSASETLLDGGLRRGLIAQYKAQYEADAAAYRQTVLTAFQQTEDYLASVRWLGEQRREQQDSIAAAQRFYDLSLIRYKTGVDTYLNVFTAQTSLLSNQQTAITLQVEQMTSSVQLIEALGGGWDTSQLPSEKAVARK